MNFLIAHTGETEPSSVDMRLAHGGAAVGGIAVLPSPPMAQFGRVVGLRLKFLWLRSLWEFVLFRFSLGAHDSITRTSLSGRGLCDCEDPEICAAASAKPSASPHVKFTYLLELGRRRDDVRPDSTGLTFPLTPVRGLLSHFYASLSLSLFEGRRRVFFFFAILVHLPRRR